MSRRGAILLAFILTITGCGHSGRQQPKPDERAERNEETAEQAQRRRRAEDIAKQQTADAERFHKDLAVINKVKVGDSYASFYRKASAARLSLDRVTDTADGRVERYAFMDNSTAFVTVVVKADHVTEIRMEGVGQ